MATIIATSGGQDQGTMRPTIANSLFAGSKYSGFSVFTRFSGVTIPQNATINSAYHTFSSGSSTPLNISVDMYKVDRGGTSPQAPTSWQQMSPNYITDTNKIILPTLVTNTAATWANDGLTRADVTNTVEQLYIANGPYNNGAMLFFIRSSQAYPAKMVFKTSNDGGEWKLIIDYTVPPVLVDKTTYVFV